MNKETKSETYLELYKLGIQGFFIVTENGLPILDRIYTDEIAKAGRIETLTSMMSTVVKFNHQLVQNGLLTDIGLQTSRIYFDFIKEIIFVLMVEEKNVLQYKLLSIQTLLKGTMANVKSLFQAKFGEIEDPDMLDAFGLKDIFGDDIIDRIDDMILKSYTDLLQVVD